MPAASLPIKQAHLQALKGAAKASTCVAERARLEELHAWLTGFTRGQAMAAGWKQEWEAAGVRQRKVTTP